jgi:hypothetical protein
MEHECGAEFGDHRAIGVGTPDAGISILPLDLLNFIFPFKFSQVNITISPQLYFPFDSFHVCYFNLTFLLNTQASLQHLSCCFSSFCSSLPCSCAKLENLVLGGGLELCQIGSALGSITDSCGK